MDCWRAGDCSPRFDAGIWNRLTRDHQCDSQLACAYARAWGKTCPVLIRSALIRCLGLLVGSDRLVPWRASRRPFGCPYSSDFLYLGWCQSYLSQSRGISCHWCMGCKRWRDSARNHSQGRLLPSRTGRTHGPLHGFIPMLSFNRPVLLWLSHFCRGLALVLLGNISLLLRSVLTRESSRPSSPA